MDSRLGDTYFEGTYKPSPEEKKDASLSACNWANSSDEAKMFLQMLGLL